jgi:hypothetical protein
MESPKPVAENWKAGEATSGHLPAAPDLATADDGEAPSDEQLALLQPPATENKDPNTGEQIDSDVATKSREVLDSSKVIEQLETSPASTPASSPEKKDRSADAIEAQAQHDAGECGCVVM